MPIVKVMKICGIDKRTTCESPSSPKARKARGNGNETEFIIIIDGMKTELFIFKIFFINAAMRPGIIRIESEKKHILTIFLMSRFCVERVWKIKAGAKRNKTKSVSVLGLIFFLEPYKNPIPRSRTTGKVMFKIYKKFFTLLFPRF